MYLKYFHFYSIGCQLITQNFYKYFKVKAKE